MSIARQAELEELIYRDLKFKCSTVSKEDVGRSLGRGARVLLEERCTRKRASYRLKLDKEANGTYRGQVARERRSIDVDVVFRSLEH